MSGACFVGGIDAVPAHAWDALHGAEAPFLTHAFLGALERSGSVGGDSGWEPQHLLLREGTRLVAAMPCYLKRHSWGEYVFDWAWADAYARHNLAYYPKLLSAVPFTPATGPRLLHAADRTPDAVLPPLLAALRARLAAEGISSWHLLFPEAQLAGLCAREDLLHRTGVQFHWLNHGYAGFDDFLASLASRKRKQLKRERRLVSEQGLRIARLRGTEVSESLWDHFYRFYQMTYARRSGHGGYLSRAFFRELATTMPEQLLLVVAFRDEQPVAGALNLIGADTLYGRYWGCTEDYAQLHFETCYYQGIEFCIEQGLRRFDAGAQGEHKLARGFEPVQTDSFHLIAHPAFREAIAGFLQRERPAMQHYQEDARQALPFRDPHV